MASLSLRIPPCHPKTLLNKSSYGCLHFAGCLILEPAWALGHDPHRAPVVTGGSLKARDNGNGFSHGDCKLGIITHSQ